MPRATGGRSASFTTRSTRVRGLARRLIGSDAAAEDVASEVFLRARRSCGSFDPARPVAGWLLGITAHLCLDSIRRRQVEQRLFEAGREVETLPADSSPGPLTLALFAERKAEVRAAIDRLPERLRTPLVLRYFAEMTYDEIAGRLGKCRAEVANLIFGAKQMLRRELSASQEEEDK